ncbi:hypothetical protein LCGC14_2495710 [marine sediment metagenome]|uniref:Uncharacterized protein n=1 Tax=marine sediment metagenome TaxID=412755 RepID=A0A0F9BRC8_9ZZZZ
MDQATERHGPGSAKRQAESTQEEEKKEVATTQELTRIAQDLPSGSGTRVQLEKVIAEMEKKVTRKCWCQYIQYLPEVEPVTVVWKDKGRLSTRVQLMSNDLCLLIQLLDERIVYARDIDKIPDEHSSSVYREDLLRRLTEPYVKLAAVQNQSEKQVIRSAS